MKNYYGLKKCTKLRASAEFASAPAGSCMRQRHATLYEHFFDTCVVTWPQRMDRYEIEYYLVGAFRGMASGPRKNDGW